MKGKKPDDHQNSDISSEDETDNTMEIERDQN